MFYRVLIKVTSCKSAIRSEIKRDLFAQIYLKRVSTGVVLSSFYYGYVFLQLPGGILALKFGGTRIFGYAIFLASLFTLFTPVATRFSVYGLIGVRVCEGLVLVSLKCLDYQ